jgi:hypothetical protein
MPESDGTLKAGNENFGDGSEKIWVVRSRRVGHYIRKIFPQGMEGMMVGFHFNSLYFLWFLRDTHHGIFFAPLELRGRWGAWIKGNLWALTRKMGQKKSLLKE